MRLVGLSGYARSGKDTAAEVLIDAGWERIAFADKLRQMLYALNPVVSNGNEYLKDFEKKYKRFQEVIDEYDWNGYKESPWGYEMRELMQRLGTEAGRNTLWDSIWVDAAFHDLKEDGNYIVTDCRFPNEAGAIKDRGGMVVRITREGVGPANSHASETSLDDWKFDSYIRNDGTLEEFQEKVRRAFL